MSLKIAALILLATASHGKAQLRTFISSLNLLLATFEISYKDDGFTTDMIEQVQFQFWLFEKEPKVTLHEYCKKLVTRFEQRYGNHWGCTLNEEHCGDSYFTYFNNAYLRATASIRETLYVLQIFITR